MSTLDDAYPRSAMNGDAGRRLMRAIVGSIVPLALLATWTIAVSAGWWPNTLIAAPREVAIAGWHLLASGELLAHARVSTLRVIEGFGIGCAAGIALGTWVGVSRSAELLLQPALRGLSPVPPTAWIPLLIVVFGIGEGAKIALLAAGTFVVIYAATVQGIRGTDARLVEVARVFEKSRGALIRQVLLPAAAPGIFTGARVALGLSWILLVAAELVSAPMASAQSRMQGLGLGWLIYDARRFSRMDDMIVGMIAIGIVGALTDWLAAKAQQRTLRWRQAFEGA